MDGMTVTYDYTSGSNVADKVWCRLAGREQAICRDRFNHDAPGRPEFTMDELLVSVTRYWQNADARDAAYRALQEKYPDNLIIGECLPSRDIDQGNLPDGWYIVVLSTRRRHGKYRILDILDYAED